MQKPKKAVAKQAVKENTKNAAADSSDAEAAVPATAESSTSTESPAE